MPVYQVAAPLVITPTIRPSPAITINGRCPSSLSLGSLSSLHVNQTRPSFQSEALFHGSLKMRKVASKDAIRTLVYLDPNGLEEDERFCNICYVPFNETSPDGVKESPVRIPACNHVFGDKCLRKWLSESPCCPYCRHQLPAAVKYAGPLKRSIADALMAQGVLTPDDDPEDHMEIMARFLHNAESHDSDEDYDGYDDGYGDNYDVGSDDDEEEDGTRTGDRRHRSDNDTSHQSSPWNFETPSQSRAHDIPTPPSSAGTLSRQQHATHRPTFLHAVMSDTTIDGTSPTRPRNTEARMQSQPQSQPQQLRVIEVDLGSHRAARGFARRSNPDTIASHIRELPAPAESPPSTDIGPSTPGPPRDDTANRRITRSRAARGEH
ncbi:RING protein [Geosmithia morbida]|uniref:RING protein n=1 Tax=Geosmithia morbida TaxID=1094350 RepID=A0A9P5D162_9HYPO|nr:RING protein [Geosmithia morbida]KAF4122402.1 RING protein [Geosmithia morbida]